MSQLLRAVLIACALAFAALAAPAQQRAAAPPRFRLTIWIVRPVVKQAPEPQEFQKTPQRWLYLKGFDKPALTNTSDSRVLDYVRKQNPLYRVARIEQKLVTIVPADRLTRAPLKGEIVFRIYVPSATRADALAEIESTHGRAIAEEFHKLLGRETMFRLDARIPHTGNLKPSPDDASVITGYRSAVPGAVYALDTGLAFSSVRSGVHIVEQIPTDVLLFCLEPAKL